MVCGAGDCRLPAGAVETMVYGVRAGLLACWEKPRRSEEERKD